MTDYRNPEPYRIADFYRGLFVPTEGTFRLALAERGTVGLGAELIPDVLGTVNVLHGDDAPLVATWALNGWGSLVLTAPIWDVDPVDYPVGGARELHLYRDLGAGEELIWGGHLWRAEAGPGSFVRLTGYGFSYTLWNKREVRTDFDFENAGNGTDVYDIARTLISYTQAKTNGDLGITFESTTDHGKHRKLVICAEETPKIGEVITDLADADNGFDWEVGADKVWRTYKPQRGTDVSLTCVFDASETVDDVGMVLDGETIENDVAGIGEVKECEPIHMSVFDDPTSQATYGLLEGSEHRPDLRWDSDHLDDLARRRLALRLEPHHHPTFKVPRTLGGPVPFVDYGLGDTVRVIAGKGYATFDVLARVLSISTRITQMENEYDELEVDTVLA